MKVLSIVSPKGGVGKTTLALNLAVAIAKRGWRVLLVDTDPQGSIGLSLAQSRGSRAGLAEFVANQGSLSQLMITTKLPEFRLLPVGNLAIHEVQTFGEHLSRGDALSRLVEEAQYGHDLLIFDTPAGFGGCTLGTLQVATDALSPVQGEPLAVRSMPQLLEMMNYLKRQGAKARFLGVVLTMVQFSQKHVMASAEEVWKSLPERFVFDTVIARDDAFLKASALGVPVSLLSKYPPPAAAAFNQLAGELEQRLGLTHDDEEDDGPISLFFD